MCVCLSPCVCVCLMWAKTVKLRDELKKFTAPGGCVCVCVFGGQRMKNGMPKKKNQTLNATTSHTQLRVRVSVRRPSSVILSLWWKVRFIHNVSRRRESAYKTLPGPIKSQTVNRLASVPLAPPRGSPDTHTHACTCEHTHTGVNQSTCIQILICRLLCPIQPHF